MLWYPLVHITFVLPAFAMGYLDSVLREKAADKPLVAEVLKNNLQ